MDKKINNISHWLFVLVLIIAAALKMLQHFVFPQYNTSSMWIVPLYFVVVYFITFTLFLVPRLSIKEFLRRFAIYKTVKLLVTMAAMLISAFVCKQDAKQLLIAFLVYYLLMIFPETLYAMYMRKNAS